MNVEYHRRWSRNLGQDMEFKVYGHAGKPVVVFPCQGGRFFEYEDFGMVEACRPFIDAGAVTLFTLDGVDRQSWLNEGAPPADRARRHNDYDRYVVSGGGPVHPGASSRGVGVPRDRVQHGGIPLRELLLPPPRRLRRPDRPVRSVQALPVRRGVMDENVYFNAPLAYLPGLTDPWYLDRYRRSRIVVCVGQGAWEDEMVADTRALQSILASKGVPAWIDFWGHDVNHDWPWWRRQIAYFLELVNL